MSTLAKVSVIDKIEVLEMGHIQVRQRNAVTEDGVELSASYHRWALNPGDDLTGQDPKVVAIANATWTSEVISAYQAMVAAQQEQR